LLDIQYRSSNEGTANDDYFRISFYAEDVESTTTELANIDVSMDDVTTDSVDSTLEWSVRTDGTLAAELNLDGAKLFPEVNAGLDLGSDANEFNDAWIDGTLYSDTSDLGAATVTSLNTHDEVRVVAFQFYDVDVAASQSAAEWGADASADVGGSAFKQIPMHAAGSVIGVSVFSNDACTTGTLTADATINGSATGLQAELTSATATVASVTQANDADTFTANQAIGVKVTTDAEWLPTTADVVVVVYVEY